MTNKFYISCNSLPYKFAFFFRQTFERYFSFQLIIDKLAEILINIPSKQSFTKHISKHNKHTIRRSLIPLHNQTLKRKKSITLITRIKFKLKKRNLIKLINILQVDSLKSLISLAFLHTRRRELMRFKIITIISSRSKRCNL